jgi:uncharacterized protein (TIGR03086 family)
MLSAVLDSNHFKQATEEFERRLAAVPADGWSGPTPNDEWDVRALVNHVVNELRWIPETLGGKTMEEVGDRFDGDLLGSDPVATYRDAMAAAQTAANDPGAATRQVHLSFGMAPGGEYLSQVTSDVTIHSWDLAKAANADTRLDDGLVDEVLAFMETQFEMWRSAGAFGPAVEIPADASAQDRLLAETGRQP